MPALQPLQRNYYGPLQPQNRTHALLLNLKMYIWNFRLISKNIQLMNRSNNEPAKMRNSLTTQESFGLNSLKNTENTIKQNRNIIVCRICLEETHNTTQSEAFVKPCRCSGSLEYVHQTCLVEWLNTMVKRRIQLGQPLQKIHCQICQDELDIEFKKKLVCRNKESLRNRVAVYWPHLLISITFIVLTLGAMGALAFFQKNSESAATEEERTTLKAIFIVGWVLLAVSFIVWIVKIFKNFLLRTETYVGRVESKPAVLELRQRVNTQSQSYAESQQDQRRPSADSSIVESSVAKRRLRVIPLKPAFRNQSADRLGDELNENANPWRI